MTKQMQDVIHYDNEAFFLVDNFFDNTLSGPRELLDIKNLGLRPNVISTGLYRGMWCEYDLDKHNGLVLRTIEPLTCDEWPKVFGVEPTPYTTDYGRESCRYENINRPIEHTGKIQIEGRSKILRINRKRTFMLENGKIVEQ